jgi:hypothetical protein
MLYVFGEGQSEVVKKSRKEICVNRSKNIHIMVDHVFYKSMIEEICKRNLVNSNKFAVKLLHDSSTLKRIENYSNIEIIPRNYNLQKIAKGYDKIIFHKLYHEDISQLSRFHKRGETIVWRQWSSDTFYILKEGDRFKHYKINSPFIKCPKKNSFLEKAKIITYNSAIKMLLWAKSAIKYYQFKNALRKIDIVGNWNAFETEQIKNLYPTFKAKSIFLHYHKPDKTKSAKPFFQDESHKVFKIFLGHNGHSDVNYEEIIDFLSNIKHSYAFNVTCVLSYGEIEYIKFILKYGKEKLGEKFIPLVDFMEEDKYFAMYDFYDVFIFNSSLQSGAGNIYHAIRMGKTVFLRDENPISCHLKQQGIVVLSINMLLNNISLLTQRIAPDDIFNNYKILTSLNVQEHYDNGMDVFIE